MYARQATKRTAIGRSIRSLRLSSTKVWSQLGPFQLVLVATVALLMGLLLGQKSASMAQDPAAHTVTHAPPPPGAHFKRPSAAARDVLVLYSFFDGDEVSWGNLQYFAIHGIQARDGVEYIVLLNGAASSDARLPNLPHNARYVEHRNECYDWGTYSWALDTQLELVYAMGALLIMRRLVDYIFINSSVRGPLLPWYVEHTMHWTDLFTSKLDAVTKLVGPAISCEHFCLSRTTRDGKKTRECRKNAHVQSVAVATDSAGLAVLQRAGYVLKCHASRDTAVFYGEIGASLAILEAGYGIDSFLTRYQGVDWTQKKNWECNHVVSPIGKRTFDGVTVAAFELVFPKLKGSLLESGLPSHFEALRISEWLSSSSEDRNITGNWFVTEPGKQLHAEDVVIAEAKGENCFDWDFYRRKNPDVAMLPRKTMWAHFLSQGAKQFREHRWLCQLDADNIIPHMR